MELTKGQSLIECNSNPNHGNAVHEAKGVCADLIDLVSLQPADSEETIFIRDKAIEAIMTAQMWVVKSLTYRK